jgi:hypothetical protein
MAVVIPIVTEFVGKGVERAIKEFKQIEGVAGKAAFVFKQGLVPGAVAAAGAVSTLGVTLFKAAQAAAEAQREDKLLADQLRRTTGATSDAIAATLDFVDALELETTISGGELSTALATLTRATGNVTQAQELLTLATDISVASQQDLQSVSMALVKASEGEFAALKKLGIPIDENTIKTKDYAKVQELLNKQFGGAASEAANTFEGQLAKLKISMTRLQEELGKVVLPYLEKLVGFINRYIVPALQVFIDRLTKGDSVKSAFEVAIASMGNFAPTVIEAMRSATNSMLEFVRKAFLVYESIKAIQVAARFFKGDLKGAALDFGTVISAAAGANITRRLQDDTNKYFDGLISRLGSLEKVARQTTGAVLETTDRLSRLEASRLKDNDGLGDGPDGGGAGGAVDRLAEKAKKLAERTKEAADALRKDMADALKVAQDRLAEAQQAFDDFSATVSGAITEQIDFGKAAQDVDMEDFGLGFMEELEAQAKKAERFGGLVEQLLQAGISKEALDKVLAAGADSGAAIADALLSETGAVLRANDLVKQTQDIADKIGLAAADKFYKAGLENGKAYLKGVEEALGTANARIAMARTPADVKGAGALFDLAVENAFANTQGTTVTNYTINSQSLNPREAGDVIVDALIEYNRRSGPLEVQIA